MASQPRTQTEYGAIVRLRLTEAAGWLILTSQRSGPGLVAGFGGAYSPAARPFKFPGALEGSRELDCLTQAVYYEARGETPSGQAAVAQVVLNRARNAAFPKTICGVVFQRASARGCQFSFACDGSTQRGREAGAWNRAQKIASRALDGFVMAEVGSATHFHTLNVAPMWGPRLLRVAQVGMHVFYRFGGRAGAPSAFTSDAAESVGRSADSYRDRLGLDRPRSGHFTLGKQFCTSAFTTTNCPTCTAALWAMDRPGTKP